MNVYIIYTNECIPSVLVLSDAKDFCPVGVFTAQNRDYWAKVGQCLLTYTMVYNVVKFKM